MKSILIVSSDKAENDRMRAALTVQGWWVAEVADRESSLRAAADQAPDLVLVDGDVAGAEDLVATFSGSSGPGVLLLGGDPEAMALATADARLDRPVDTGVLVRTVQRLLVSPRKAPEPVLAGAGAGVRWTAADIFADVLEEVETGGVSAREPSTASDLFVDSGAPIATPFAPAPTPASAPAAAQAAAAPAADPLPQRFGNYELVERIAVGGMAEVWRARKTGVEGFEKTVAIKKILPHLTESGDFEKMFIDEAKVAANLEHDNIVRINDLGQIGDEYFIAMEYVDGKDLRNILNAVRRRGEVLPRSLAVLIATRLASALDYAHRQGDSAAGIVHRDVSPRNVLIGVGGVVKLCDFGIAKASSSVSQTKIGAIKGKLQFMSPEQAWGRPVDQRSDIFSLGVVVFEMLTGERLFTSDNEISLLEAVRTCAVREPRQVNPAIPEELNAVVVRALQRELEDRYQSAGEMQRDLEAVLYAMRPTPGSEDLSAFVTRLYAAVEPPAGAPESVPPAQEPPPAASVAEMPEAVVAAAPLPALEASALEAPSAAGDESASSRRRTLLVAGGVAALAVAVYLVIRLLAAEDPVALAPPGALPAAAPAGEATAEPPPDPPPTPAAVVPAAAADPQDALEDLVSRELARREAELRRTFENEQEQLLEEFGDLDPAAAPADEPPAADSGDDGGGI